MTCYNPFSLKDKTILITGASSGIGRATAIECSKLDAKVILVGRNEDRLKETLSLMENQDLHTYYKVDITHDDEVDELVSSLPGLNGLVNNAGIVKTILTKFIKRQNFEEIVENNTVSPILLTSKLLKKKKILKNGSIVFTSSIGGPSIGLIGNGIYSASKAAIEGFVKCACLELATNNIRVNTVKPGMTNTKLITDTSVSKDDLEQDKQNYPLQRYGEPREIALGIVYLLSDAASWTTGTSLTIDGGYTAK